MPMQGAFDANQFAPKQIGESHPPGKFPFVVGNTEIVPTKDQTGGMFVVTFNTPAGNAVMRYNLWNQNAKAVEIAHGQLSALCHATGVFRLQWENDGAALRGAKGMIDIGYQKGEEPSPEKPAGGYTEVKKVLDVNGNEPGKAPANAPQPQPGQQNQPAGNGGWANPNAAPANPAPQSTSWGNPANTQQGQQPQNNNPPWAKS